VTQWGLPFPRLPEKLPPLVLNPGFAPELWYSWKMAVKTMMMDDHYDDDDDDDDVCV